MTLSQQATDCHKLANQRAVFQSYGQSENRTASLGSSLIMHRFLVLHLTAKLAKFSLIIGCSVLFSQSEACLVVFWPIRGLYQCPNVMMCKSLIWRDKIREASLGKNRISFMMNFQWNKCLFQLESSHQVKFVLCCIHWGLRNLNPKHLIINSMFSLL